MAIVKPFKAVRATRDKVAMVSSKSYEIYTSEMLKAKLAFNPYSFLHVINPGYKYHKEDISGEQRFKLVHNRYLEFKEDKIFTQDEAPAFYIYQKTTPTNSFCGIIAATSVEDYHNDVIKKHEGTLRERELLFENYLKNTGFNSEPVLLTYPDNDVIESIIKKYQAERAEYEFSTTDKDHHLLWIVNDKNDIKQITKAFDNVDTLYIADGHHRSTSSCLLAKNLAKENPDHTGKEKYNSFMSYLLPESQLSIYEFNRFIKDLNGLTPDEFLIELDTFFRIENRGQELYRPKEKHHFSMYLNGEFYALYLRKSAYEFTDSLSRLDAQILYTTVLKPILGINDIRNASKIIYSQDKSDSLELKTKVDSGDFKISFGMLPTTIEELKSIVDSGKLMPPKTTYIEPKLRSALTIYEF
ncbi:MULTISPECIES: DUF1015 domain-containing protein [unclassified Tenacibaculum]|uniref:DUF1015 domain-containing protein n=1 Tax=unclassified Tenacibaculum TaxID=2635139 RepID=UPI001F337B94|nr:MULTISPECIES: DUF1015 domain-containing protein [unclassified Tenacibaculum]MCF2874233.1 DUF1015 domain-containing protein [Tenacibaculum sp. Cn5-1]MCF2934814.1 DUF1015 domain-containing protein [Tenacibaculum sp. Cn5-34]MCG7511024.1 DUF1015 domain-containing protein [Tenacibaculum sp. Cn5-46]